MNGDTFELRRVETGELVAWIMERPRYCNRGRFHAVIEAPVTISHADPWPRYYFVLNFAMAELRYWLEAHGVDITGLRWTVRRAPPGTVDMDALVNEPPAPAPGGER